MTKQTLIRIFIAGGFFVMAALLASCSSEKDSADNSSSKEQTEAPVSAEKNETVKSEPAPTKAEISQPVAALANAEISEAQKKLGKRSFIRCAACHTLGAGEPHRVGPNLNGLFGAKAAVKEGFTYSEALVNAEVTWNEETLTAWLKSPSKFVPGNKMAFAGVANDNELQALLIYLKENTQ